MVSRIHSRYLLGSVIFLPGWGLAPESVFLTSDGGELSAIPRLETEDGSPAGPLSFVGHIVRLRWTEDGASVSTNRREWHLRWNRSALFNAQFFNV